MIGKQKRSYVLAGIFVVAVSFFCIKNWVPSIWAPVRLFLLGLSSTKEVVEKIRPEIKNRLERICHRHQVKYPPEKVTLISLKLEKVMEVWARDATSRRWKKLTKYSILASSGRLGPKRKEGDKQIPEGIYKVVSLNPNSRFHLSIKINYPNKFDRTMARRTGRQKLGGNIFIHGGNASNGCLAVGNAAIEELFVLVHDTGMADTKVIIAPYDFRESSVIKTPQQAPEWVDDLYETIGYRLQNYSTE